MSDDLFCNAFDAALAQSGPASVFLPDREGKLRFDESWTRDAWGHHPGPHPHGWRWLLLRDHDTTYVTLVFVTSPTLIPTHPRADVRSFATRAEAEAARAAFGEPPLCASSWSA